MVKKKHSVVDGNLELPTGQKSKSVDLGDGFRMLGPKEKVKDGDEVCLELPDNWDRVSKFSGVKPGDKCAGWTVRRRVGAD